jgi:hypothetical protein
MRTKIYKDKGDISYLTLKLRLGVNDADSFVTAQTIEYFN